MYPSDFQELVNIIPKLAPHLRCLRVAELTRYNHHLAGIEELIPHMQNLRYMYSCGLSLTLTSITRLSMLPALRFVQFIIDDSESKADMMKLWPNAFPVLEALTFWGGYAESRMEVVRAISSPRLNMLKVWVHHPEEFKEVIAIASKRWTETLCDLSIFMLDNRDDAGEEKEKLKTGIAQLGPLLNCHKLTTLKLENFNISVSEDEIQLMKEAWPHLNPAFYKSINNETDDTSDS
jgi:hypothetical protein